MNTYLKPREDTGRNVEAEQLCYALVVLVNLAALAGAFLLPVLVEWMHL